MRLRGYSLLETSVVLIIMALLSGGVIKLVQYYQLVKAAEITERHKEIIFHALALHRAQRNVFPCPAKPVKAGGEADSCKDADSCIGIVPYRNLGLSPEIAKDGYGRWFTYVKEPDDYKRGYEAQGSQDGGEEPKIQLQDINTRCVLPSLDSPEYKYHIPFLLICHGPKGGGSFREDSNEKMPAINEYEQQNAKTDFTFWTGKSVGFTHRVYWVNIHYLMAKYAFTHIPGAHTRLGEPGENRRRPPYTAESSRKGVLSEDEENVPSFYPSNNLLGMPASGSRGQRGGEPQGEIGVLGEESDSD